jgi:hypothetical protein
MKKIFLELEGHEVLTKEQMKNLIGGRVTVNCYAVDYYGDDYGDAFAITAENCCAAQAAADYIAYDDIAGADLPYGMNCECACND